MSIIPSGGIEDLLAPLKKRMEKLDADCRQLELQLAQVQQENANLKRGIGITLLIDGKAVQIGSGPLPDIAMPSPQLMTPQNVYAPLPSGPTPYATPAVINERHAPHTIPNSNPGATTPNLFGNNSPKPYVPPTPSVGMSNSDNRAGNRGANFFLD